MEDKLRKLMKHEGINSTRLAELLGIQASGISHIMSGRNKPSYDFIVKLLGRFPQLNPDWLLLDKGPMYRDQVKNISVKSSVENISDVKIPEIVSASLFDVAGQSLNKPSESKDAAGMFRDDNDIIPAVNVPNLISSQTEGRRDESKDGVSEVVNIEKIIVLFSDSTCKVYNSRK